MEKSDANDLFAMLDHVRSAWSAVCASSHCDRAATDTARLKGAALDLYFAIGKVCSSGQTVRLYSARCGGRVHTVRTMGPLNPDGITFRYSDQRADEVTHSNCAMPAMQWIDSVYDGGIPAAG